MFVSLSLAPETWLMGNVVEKIMHFELGGLSPVSAVSELCDLRAQCLHL